MSDGSRTIVLTGASRGLGQALAQELVRLGHVVHGCARTARSADDVGFGLDAVDVTDAKGVTNWAQGLIARGAVPDILICNAAIINAPAPLWAVPAPELRDVITTNVLGTGYTLQAFVPAMVARGSGVIVTLSSGWGRGTDAEMAPYCASKFAVEGLTLSLAKELPSGLAAVPMNPGIVQTEMLRKCWGRQAEAFELPDAWARRAAKFILEINASDNGRQLTVPAP